VIEPKDGLIGQFYNRYLAELVDDEIRPWQLRGGSAAALGLTPDHLRFFESAKAWGDAFFETSQPSPEFALELSVVAWGGDLAELEFSLGRRLVSFKKGGVGAAQRMTWPGPEPSAGVTVSVKEEDKGILHRPKLATFRQAGSWGFFKLINRGGFRPLGAGETVRFNIETDIGSVFMSMKMVSDKNPFTLLKREGGIKCPSSF